jgi:hypothetical protein
MKKLALLTLSLVALTGLSACNDYSTPSGVVATAGRALEKDKAKTFKRTLTGEALARYGNDEDMAALRAELSVYEVKSLRTFLTSTEIIGRHHKILTYSVDGIGKKRCDSDSNLRTIFNATVVCNEHRTHRMVCSGLDAAKIGHGRPHYRPGRPTHCYRENVVNTYCQISKLDLK